MKQKTLERLIVGFNMLAFASAAVVLIANIVCAILERPW